MQKNNVKAGFTLVEMAMVLTIAAIIMGGFVGMHYLLYAAKINSVITEVNKYKIAISSFNDQYGWYPGDMPNASQLWPNANVPNGNGDGYIGSELDNGHSPGDVNDPESLAAFYDLSQSGLIAGAYTGYGAPQIGVNLPGSKYAQNAAYHLVGGSFLDAYMPLNALLLTQTGNDNSWNSPAVFLPDAQAIDTKIDDGAPFTGQVISYNLYTTPWGAYPCTSVLTPNPNPGQPFSPWQINLTATYNTSNASNGNYYFCTMQFALQGYTFSQLH